MIKLMNDYGKDGWELVAVTREAFNTPTPEPYFYIFFKRKVSPDEW